ncbi:hypothetical protein SNE40_012448 [Patella caerulea]|uniref:NAD(P)(+)--arginine ADP-ribosyltransferase n=1 Tax=Patella caerulea TaxID=87958 RepID=A0AAN8JPY0_PATCE
MAMKFDCKIDLVRYNSRSGIEAFSEPITESDEILEDVLLKEAGSFNHETFGGGRYTTSSQPNKEAAVNPSFREAWAAAGKSKELPNLVKEYETLKKSEIKLIMAYTYEREPRGPGKPSFYKELNEDFRNNDLTGGRFPYAKRVLRNALIELAKFQKKKGKNLPDVLYRWEPSCHVKNYQEQGDGWMHLNMFTSTSSRKDLAHNAHNNVQVEFRKPETETGASIRDFSFYRYEEEVLLPPLHGKIKVIEASTTGSILQGPIL